MGWALRARTERRDVKGNEKRKFRRGYFCLNLVECMNYSRHGDFYFGDLLLKPHNYTHL
jgi:hypothetical protein